MKKTTLLIFALLLGLMSYAQKWETDFNVAKKRAAEEGKNIVLVFSGSDWCAPCMKLEKNIWESQDFIDYSNQHFVLLRADFPRRKANSLPTKQQEANNRLAEKYNKQGLFPMVDLLDKDGQILGTTGYKNVSPAEYIKILHSFEK